MAPIVKRDYSAAMTRKTLTFLNVLLDRPQDFLLENKKYEIRVTVIPCWPERLAHKQLSPVG